MHLQINIYPKQAFRMQWAISALCVNSMDSWPHVQCLQLQTRGENLAEPLVLSPPVCRLCVYHVCVSVRMYMCAYINMLQYVRISIHPHIMHSTGEGVERQLLYYISRFVWLNRTMSWVFNTRSKKTATNLVVARPILGMVVAVTRALHVVLQGRYIVDRHTWHVQPIHRVSGRGRQRGQQFSHTVVNSALLDVYLHLVSPWHPKCFWYNRVWIYIQTNTSASHWFSIIMSTVKAED